MKYSQLIGVIASITIVIACFLPWAYYPDLDKTFTGFFSEQNMYGRPGKPLILLSAFAMFFFIVPKIWAKRWNLLINAIALAYAIKTFILFSSCYRGVCPDKKFGIWLMLVAAIIMMLSAVLPNTRLKRT